MIHHLVSWQLRDDIERTNAIATIRTEMTSLLGVVPPIRTIEVVENVAYPAHNHDVAVVATFDTVEDLDAFTNHPVHQAAGVEIRKLVVARAAIDWAE
ncbi:Dabb family protein [Curtobacterium luteum]|uniref:Dabb family protein n=1 Tax=Curtobacterium luteum TaxID=33881 RepID=UPI00381C3143